MSHVKLKLISCKIKFLNVFNPNSDHIEEIKEEKVLNF